MESFPRDSPFYGLSISSHQPLRDIKERHICEGCNKSCRYFCYRCIKLIPGLVIPQVKLPFNLTIVKHSRELEGKSTAVHAKLISPSQVQIKDYDPTDPSTLEYFSRIKGGSSSVVLFPDEDAKEVSDIDWSCIERVIVIDGTWQQAKSIIRSPHFEHLTKRVKLSTSNNTLFWRYQQIGPHCLSTIEAIYRLSQEIQKHLNGDVDSNLDDLMYFFSFFYEKIQEQYKADQSKIFTLKHRPDYIRK